MARPFPPLLLIRALFRRLGFHPEDAAATEIHLSGRALVVATNRAALDVGKATGVFASELTTACYVFADAGLEVDVASLAGVLPSTSVRPRPWRPRSPRRAPPTW